MAATVRCEQEGARGGGGRCGEGGREKGGCLPAGAEEEPPALACRGRCSSSPRSLLEPCGRSGYWEEGHVGGGSPQIRRALSPRSTRGRPSLRSASSAAADPHEVDKLEGHHHGRSSRAVSRACRRRARERMGG